MSQAEELLDSLDETIPTHQHDVIDSNSYFVIDPITRAVENTSGSKNLLMQYDHASERYTFELPRYVEGHDMSLCTAVKVHYNNIESGTLIENADVNDLDDLHVDPTDANKVICSWLIKRQATQLVGSLNFLVQYLCATSDGTITYEWHSDIYKNIEIREGRNNGPAAVSDYTDILEQWRAKLFGVEDSITASILALLEDFSADVLKKDNTEEYTPTENYHPSTKKYVDDNISKLSEEIANKLGSEELSNAVNTALAQAKESGAFDGADGYTPVKGTDYFTEEDKSELVNDVLEQVEIPESGGGIDVTGATVGQIVQVAEVDENGVPTAWSAVDKENKWELLTDIELKEESTIELITYDDKYKEFYGEMILPKLTEKITTTNAIIFGQTCVLYYTTIGDLSYREKIQVWIEYVTDTLINMRRVKNALSGIATFAYDTYSVVGFNVSEGFRLKSSLALPAGTTIKIFGKC